MRRDDRGSLHATYPGVETFFDPGLFFALNLEPRQKPRPIPLSLNNLRSVPNSVPCLLPQTETRQSGPLGTSRSLRSRFVSRKQRHPRLGSCPPLASLSSFGFSKSRFGVMRPRVMNAQDSRVFVIDSVAPIANIEPIGERDGFRQPECYF